jgi:hypothetical protein
MSRTDHALDRFHRAPHSARILAAAAVGVVIGAGALVAGMLLFGAAAGASASCTIYWTGLSAGNNASWTDVGNWSLTDGGSTAGRTPDPSDYVCMSTVNSPPNGAVVMDDATPVTVAGIDWLPSSGATLTVASGDSLTIGPPGSEPASQISALTVEGTFVNDARLTVDSATSGSTLVSAGTLTNKATLTFSSNEVDLGNSSDLENMSGATVVLVDNSTIGEADSTSNIFKNDSGGTISYTGGSPSASATISVPFSDAGNISVSAGTVAIDGGGTLGSTAAVTSISGGVGLINSTVAPATGGGSLDGFTLANLSTLLGPGTFTVGAGSTFTNEGGSLTGGLTLVNDGTTDLAGGSTLGFDAAGTSGSTFENASGGDVLFTDGSGFGNSDSSPHNSVQNDAGATFTYAGSAADQVATIGVHLVDDGAASVTEGTLSITGGATIGSTQSASGLGVFSLDSQAVPAPGTGGVLTGMTIAGDGSLSGPGTFTLPAGDTISCSNLASLIGKSHVLVDGSLDVRAGDSLVFSGGSKLEIASGGTLVLFNGSALSDGDGNTSNILQVDDGGTVNLSDIENVFNAQVNVNVSNAGTLSASTGGTLSVGSTLSVLSTARASGGGAVDATGFVTPDTSSRTGSIGGLVISGAALAGPGTLTVPAGSAVSLQNGAAVGTGSAPVQVVNSGNVSIADLATVSVNGGSKFENSAGGALTLADGAVLQSGDGNTLNILANDAGATVSYAGSTNLQKAWISTNLSNAGTLQVSTGTLVLGSLTNLASNGVLAGGTYIASAPAGTLELAQDLTSISGPTTLTIGVGGHVSTASGANALAMLKGNGGTFNVEGSASIGKFVNSAVLNVSGTLNATTFAQSRSLAITTVSVGATLNSGPKGTGPIAVSGGTIRGGGALHGAASLSGIFETDVKSGKTQTLKVLGPLAIGGAFAIVTDGSPPSTGSTFTALSSGALTGRFSSISGAVISTSLYYVPSYNGTSVSLHVGPAAITDVSPNHAGDGAVSFPVTLTGAGIPNLSSLASPETGVSFSSVKVSATGTTIRALVTVASTAKPGVLDIVVRSVKSGSLTCAKCLTIDAAPKVTSLAPATVARDKKNVTVIVNGSGFVPGPSARLTLSAPKTTVSGVTIIVSGITATKLTLSVTTTATATLGRFNVTVTNGDGGVGTLAAAFTVTK